MVKRNVVWTRTADIQFAGILEYWVNRNESNVYAKKLIRLVTERTRQLAENPFICKLSDFENMRVASLGNFSIYYKITNTQIIISAFWDNRQDPKKLLEVLQSKSVS